jgi:hypothetical protein
LQVLGRSNLAPAHSRRLRSCSLPPLWPTRSGSQRRMILKMDRVTPDRRSALSVRIPYPLPASSIFSWTSIESERQGRGDSAKGEDLFGGEHPATPGDQPAGEDAVAADAVAEDLGRDPAEAQSIVADIVDVEPTLLRLVAEKSVPARSQAPGRISDDIDRRNDEAPVGQQVETDQLRAERCQVKEGFALPGEGDPGKVPAEERLVALSIGRVVQHGVDVAQDLLRARRLAVAPSGVPSSGRSR